MVVDDELSMRELLEYMLTKEGYRVTCAETGRKAVGLLEKKQYDLLLCDIKLGDISGGVADFQEKQSGYGCDFNIRLCLYRNCG